MTDDKKPAITKSSLARMAGNIAAGMVGQAYYFEANEDERHALIAVDAVKLARLIAQEVERSE